MAQTNDSLAVETPLDSIQTQNIKIQEVKISENETFIYQKPKIWDSHRYSFKKILSIRTCRLGKHRCSHSCRPLGH